MEDNFSRRDFMKLGLEGVAAFGIGSSLGCKKRRKFRRSFGPVDLMLLEEEKTFWEDVSSHVDNSVEGGFAFDFRNKRFGDVAEIDGEKHYLGAQGYVFEEGGKKFTISSLKEGERGLSLDLMERDGYVGFGGIRGFQSVVVDGERYDLNLQTIAIPDGNGLFIPHPLLSVNGKEAEFSEGVARSEGLNFSVDLQTYFDRGEIGLFVSKEHFRSAYDQEDDTFFSGLEDVVGEKKNANFHNGVVQEDAYFRISADVERDEVVLGKAEKIRIPDRGVEEFFDVDSRRPEKYEVEIRVEEKNEVIVPRVSGSSDGLKGEFLFEFSPELEARVTLRSRSAEFIPELSNVEFNSEGRNYLIRYVGFDPRKIFRSSQPEKMGRDYLPVNSLTTEILEEPSVVSMGEGMIRDVRVGEDVYNLALKDVRDGDDQRKEYLFEVGLNGEEGRVIVRGLSHGYPNRALGINIDPDVLDENVFFVSRNKFSSSSDFVGDSRLSGLKKVLVPNYKDAFSGFDRPLHEFVDYKQVTFANRLNGEIVNSGFRVNAEFGLDLYRKRIDNRDDSSHLIVPSKGFDFSDQITNGYILRIKSFEKVK